MTIPTQSLGLNNGADSILTALVEEIAAKYQAGEPVDVDACLREHPEQAGRLRALLPTVQVLADLGRSAAAGEASVPPTEADLGPEHKVLGDLGDFRIVREIGRGGMGVVYEAEQVSLGRTVALKVLPFAATLDPRQLQRFKNEAQAAAHLQHTNIVPVHFVGCERGVHYYAMQYIEGQSLAQVIADLRMPNADCQAIENRQSKIENTAVALTTERSANSPGFFRTVARLGIQAAEALDHAHEMGIVHRDIKPGNLLVDARGNLWIADFGLAQFQRDVRLTLTGDVVGTLRYMSPEQALAKRVVIDHRSDIYSLGATLYELLTLEPVFNGRDREELLRQIAFEEPQRPRRLRRAIPAELETIVLKSLEKNPQDRYGTAQELANDLRCFLEYRPIKARRPSLLQRGRRWALRHRAAVGAAALVFLVAFVALAVSTVLIWEEKEKTKEALAESETNRKLAQKNAAEAQAKRQRAENNFRKGLNGMTKLANELRTDQFPDVRRITLVRNKLSARVLKFAQRFINETSTDPGERHETAGAYVSIGTLYRQQGESAKAKQAFEKAAAVFQKLVKDYPTDSFYWLELGHAHVYLASHLETMGLKSPALVEYRNNVRAFQTACRLDPKNIRCMNNQTWSLIVSQHLEMRDPEIAFEVAKRAVDRAPTNPPTWHNLGRALYYQKDWKGALHALEKALRRTPVATSYDFLSLAMTHWEFGNKAEARQWFDQGVGWIKKNEPYDAPLLLLQAEAAGLLGVEQRQTMEGNVISLRKE